MTNHEKLLVGLPVLYKKAPRKPEQTKTTNTCLQNSWAVISLFF